MQTILAQAIALLGPPAKPDDGRGWTHWWCPFHADSERAGQGGTPNFGIRTSSEKGYWKCLRCGARGGSLAALRHKLPGARQEPYQPIRSRPPAGLAALDEALAESRAALMRSPVWEYTRSRGVRPPIILTYGLGYGVAQPRVSTATQEQARQSRLVRRDGRWLWAEGVVYADPPTAPRTIQVRHLRRGEKRKYQTWGKLLVPLGAWRLKPNRHQILIVTEGMFDMLAMAQAIHDRSLPNFLPLYTGGASVSRAMLNWFEGHPQYAYVLVPDNDGAGEDWTAALTAAIKRGGGLVLVEHAPENLDPDEALLAGWWPESL